MTSNRTLLTPPSTFGIGANGPHDWDEGSEYIYEGAPTLRRLWSFGFALSPRQTARYEKHKAVGRFEGDRFDPETWKPGVPTAAYLEMRDDDAFWAARCVMAFSDELIRAIVKTGQFSDPRAEQYLADVLIKRRDKIARAYLTRINPVIEPALDATGVLTFSNAALRHGFAPEPEGYAAVWYRFDKRHRQLDANRRDLQPWGNDAGPARAAGVPGSVRKNRAQRIEQGAPIMGQPGRSVLPPNGRRLDARRSGPAAVKPAVWHDPSGSSSERGSSLVPRCAALQGCL